MCLESKRYLSSRPDKAIGYTVRKYCTYSIGLQLVHGAVGAGSTYRTRSGGINSSVCSVLVVLLMPGHTVLARVSSNLVHEVVQ